MANRRFTVHEIRHVISRMRLGESDRQIAKAGLMGRVKAGKLRLLAQDQGWLDKDSPLPANEVIEQLTRKTSPTKRGQSQVLPFADQVLAGAGQGIAWTTIHQTLVRKFAFTGSYDAVKRFLRHHKQERPATVMLDHAPGDVAQVDFGAGPKIIDLGTGEVLGTWVFVMTLAWSRHQYAEVVWDQKVETWLGRHRRAFEFFGGVPARIVIDNPKCAITKACYHDPEVQRAYAEIAEGYGFLISPCPPRDPQKKGFVESGVKYIKNNFLPLRDFLDITDANRQLLEWIQDEVARREQRKLGMRLRRAGCKSQKTLETFDFAFNASINRSLVLDLATCRFLEEKANILIAGPCGTGKSHLAQALGHCAIRCGHDVVFLTLTQMLQQLQAARAVGEYDRKFQYLTRVDLLVIDDFGLKPLTANQDEDFHDVVAERYQPRPTIITSNLDFEGWGEAFQNGPSDFSVGR